MTHAIPPLSYALRTSASREPVRVLIKTLSLLSALIAAATFAAPSEQEIARLNKDLTPVGAERAGKGDIPEWSGEDPKSARVLAKEAPLFVINQKNLDQYKALLSEGQIQMIKNWKDYVLPVYASKRWCGHPAFYGQRTLANTKIARANPDSGVLEESMGAALPFPFPKNGVEAMWNHKLRYMGEGITHTYGRIQINKGANNLGGSFVSRDSLYFPMGSPKVNKIADAQGREIQFFSEVITPVQNAGDLTLTHGYVAKGTENWLYFSAQRRLRRAPTFSYDAPIPGYDNLLTVDQFAMFNGPLDRYDFKLIGKREMIVPYNWAVANDYKSKVSDVTAPAMMKREAARYEQHRVWVVEASVKKGNRHLFPKRTFFLDEDTWQIVAQDLYDGQGKIQRVMESGPFFVPQIQACANLAFASYDLSLGRFIIDQVAAEQVPGDWNAIANKRISASSFDPESIKNKAER